jgi:hypothetical protein
MIVDCFSFFNEYDVLEGRLEYLYPTVDYFVIVESDRTHTGKPKPLNFSNNISRYSKYLDKILYFPYTSKPIEFYETEAAGDTVFSPSMLMDHAQRNHMSKALKLFGPEVFVMISDLDEIPSRRAINYAANNLRVNLPAIGFIQDMFYYNLNQKQVTPWVGTIMTTNRMISEKNPQWFREARWTLPHVGNAGWHISYWGDIEKIQYKIENFAHQELNSETNSNPSVILQRIQQGLDLFGRENNQFVPVDRSTLPTDMLDVFSKYEPIRIPHFYESVEGWFNPGDIAFYKEIIDQFNGPAHFVEIGSYKGKSSSFMAVEIANSKKNIKFDCVDTWEGSPEHQAGGNLEDPDVINDLMFDVFKKNMEPLKDYYTAKRMPSLEAVASYPDNSLDFVFIDADHSYQSVREDIIAWWPKVKNGGIISGHDYQMGTPGVIAASNELLGYVRVTGSCWWHKKKI